MPSDFYVYILFDWRGVPRYVGKGRGARINQHAADRKSPKPFVQETISLLGDMPRLKIREALSEHAAFALEQALIDAIGLDPAGTLVNKTNKGSGPNSQQVRDWHASRSAEERRAHMRPAIEASRNSDATKRNSRKTIKLAQAALTPEHHLEAARRLNAAMARCPEKRVAASAKRLAATTPEQRSATAKKGLAKKSPSQLSAVGRRRNEFITPEMRSEIGRKRSAYLTADQRAKNAQRLIGNQTAAQLSANGKKGAASLSFEQRSEMSRKRAHTLGPERLREIAMKMVEARLRKKKERSQS